jgi:hypothetical protein
MATCPGDGRIKVGRLALRVTSHQSKSAAASETGAVQRKERCEILEGLWRDFESIF